MTSNIDQGVVQEFMTAQMGVNRALREAIRILSQRIEALEKVRKAEPEQERRDDE